MRRLALVAMALAIGCGPAAQAGAPDGASVSVGSQNAPERFGFGAPASAARVAMWDIDVKPDGEGLPAGSGTVAEGAAVYRTSCIACHGLTGTEGPNDRLVSDAAWEEWPGARVIGSYWPYATTLYDYIIKAMPQLTPGTLTPDETYAVIAYILNLNGLVPDDGVMDAETLPAIEMPMLDRFVPDDRTGGSVIR